MRLVINIELITDALPELTRPLTIPDDKDTLLASAVLMILHKVGLQWQLLFTKRSPHLNNHGGQICFPGGCFEKEDQHLLATAIRETDEEIGLDKKYLQVISQLQEQPTLTGYRIFPYIAVANNLPELIIDEAEVVEVFSVPLQYLLDKNNQQEESAFYKGKNRIYYKIIWQDKMIWGATAQMIVTFSRYLSRDISRSG